jgi:hypothetical protein
LAQHLLADQPGRWLLFNHRSMMYYIDIHPSHWLTLRDKLLYTHPGGTWNKYVSSASPLSLAALINMRKIPYDMTPVLGKLGNIFLDEIILQTLSPLQTTFLCLQIK